MSNCPSCGYPLPTDAAECRNCGESVQPESQELKSNPGQEEMPAHVTCSACGTVNQQHHKFCTECGSTLSDETTATKQDRNIQTKSRKSLPSTLTLKSHNAVFLGAALFFVVTAFVVYTDQPSHEGHDHSHEHAAPRVDLQRLNQMRQYAEANPEDLDAQLTFAHLLQDSGLYEEAILQYRKYLGKNPDNPDARIDLGVCYFDLGRYQEAANQMESTMAEHPGHQKGAFNLGIVYSNMGENKKAEEWFKHSIAIDPATDVARSARQIMQQLQTN